MGAKQSKRSVDISGKEAESAGEVAAAGAGGEGRVEPIADADALKPQLNGDAHIQPPQDISDKEKQLDSGTPENEKDATTEKEGKEEQNDEKEATPVTNGANDPKEENGDSVPTPEDGKKPKKEKVKKKWSLRSISFSRKEKPKQEKKPKEEEPKTNGEPEKVPEEAAEATPETVEHKTTEVKVDAEVKEQQTPETPVTEPLTNGSSTPESPKVETLASDEPASVPATEQPQATPATETKPEQLAVNGLSLEEPKREAPEVAPIEESKSEESTPVAKETVPVPEIPVKTEVCDAKMPLIEPTPPPLPANPPPSSVASFAATTMAPELIEASLSNTTENAILTPPAIPDTKADKPDEVEADLSKTNTNNTDLAISQLSHTLKETISEDQVAPTQMQIETINRGPEIPEIETVKIEPVPKAEEMVTNESTDIPSKIENKTEVEVVNKSEVIIATIETDVEKKVITEVNVALAANANSGVTLESQNRVADDVAIENKEVSIDLCTEKNNEISEPTSDVPDTIDEELPPPPPLEEIDNIQREDKEIEYQSEIIENTLKENTMNDNHNALNDPETNGVIDETAQLIIKNMKKDALGNIIDTIECNGNNPSEESVPEELSTPALAADAEEMYNGKAATTPDDSLPPSLSEAPAAASDASDSLPPPPADLPDPDHDADSLRLQDSLPIADKIADLMPEIPTVPELKTETESASQVAVAD